MKVDEIRSRLEEWPREDIIKLVTMTYRKVPKEKKEEIDEVIQSGFSSSKAKKAPAPSKSDIQKVIGELDIFIEDAKEGRYYFTNQKISKKERANWRFTAGRFIKSFLLYTQEDPEFDESNRQLCRIYDILGYATSFYTFASQDPYHTLGYESQRAFFQMLCDRVLSGRRDDATLSALIACGCNGYNDPDTIDSEIHEILLASLTNSGVNLEHVRRLTEKLFEPYKQEYEAVYKGKPHFSIEERLIEVHSKYDSYGWFLPAILVEEGKALEAYECARKLDISSNLEIDLYCLLTYYIDGRKDWLAVYEKALQDGIIPRNSLKERYEKRKAEGL